MHTASSTQTALVLGASGGVGGEIAAALLRRGWQVRGLARDPATAAARTNLPTLQWHQGDALNPAQVLAAADGAEIIVHAVNPPRYERWGELVLPMLESSIRAARVNNATVFLPAPIYGYGPDSWPLLRADAPQNPTTRKGRIRTAMETRLRETNTKTIVLRAGDYFGARGTANTWFSAMLNPARTRILYPGKPGVGHAWAYLPDVGETAARLIERRAELPPVAGYNMDGHWDSDGTELIAAIRRVLGKPRLAIWPFPWSLAMLLAPVMPFFNEMREMRYLWRQPLRLDNAGLRGVLGSEPHTGWDEAVAGSL